MGFDAENFGLGLIIGWATAYGVYRARNEIREAWENINKGAQTVQNSATRSGRQPLHQRFESRSVETFPYGRGSSPS